MRLRERGVSSRKAQSMAEHASLTRQVTLLDRDGIRVVVETREAYGEVSVVPLERSGGEGETM